MTSADSTKRIASLLGKLRTASSAAQDIHAKSEPDATANVSPDSPCSRWKDAVLTELIRSILIEDSDLTQADAQLSRLCAEMVDTNELRVCLPTEVMAILQSKSPESSARAASIRSALGEIFRREHAVSLNGLIGHAKREVAEYIGSLPGVSTFAAARTLLLALDVHAMPVDACLAARLSAAGVVEKSASPAEVAALLSKAVRPGEGPAAYQLLRQWSQGLPTTKRSATSARAAGAPPSRRAPTRRKSKAS